MSTKKQVLVPKLKSDKKQRPSSDVERSRSARPSPMMQTDVSSRVFVTGGAEGADTADTADFDGLTDEQIEALMDGAPVSRSLNEMLAELEEIEASVRNEKTTLAAIQRNVTEMKKSMDQSAKKTQENEENVIAIVAEATTEQLPDPEAAPRSDSRSVTLPEIRRAVVLDPPTDEEETEASMHCSAAGTASNNMGFCGSKASGVVQSVGSLSKVSETNATEVEGSLKSKLFELKKAKAAPRLEIATSELYKRRAEYRSGEGSKDSSPMPGTIGTTFSSYHAMASY